MASNPMNSPFSSVIPAYASSGSLAEGFKAYRKIVKSCFHHHTYVVNALIDMYVKFGKMHNARVLFDKMEHRGTVSWTAMIVGYARNGLLDEAENLFKKMPYKDAISCNAMISRYAQNGLLDEAVKLSKEIQNRDTTSWNAIIAGYAQNGLIEEALKVFEEMQRSGVQPNEFTFSSVVPAYASSGFLREGVDIHRKIIRSGFHLDVVVVNALIDMYAKFRNMHMARLLFDKMNNRSTISWTAMIRGYTQNGLLDEAEELFKEMHQRDTISWTAMIAGYAQNGFLDKALELFNAMPQRNTISWNAMIAGYTQNGRGLEALKIFHNMQLTGLRPNSTTFASILHVCATFAALEQGMEIQGKIIRSGFLSHIIVLNALIDMYAKCGSIQEARVLFHKMQNRDTTSWTAIIGGYAMHGCGKEAIKLFEQMTQLDMSPNHVTLISVLSACSHTGLVEEGYQYFNSMRENYHITPAMEHYTCMVDLLGLAGRLDEAKDFINSMPIRPDAVV